MYSMTPKERKFAAAYAKSPDEKAAALAAGYSKTYAAKKAWTILKRPHVVSEIRRIHERLNERADKSATDVVNEFARIAFTDRTSFLKDDPLYPGQFIYKAPDELNAEQKALIEKVHVHNVFKEGKDGQQIFVRQIYSYTLCDKAKALDQMGRHFGLFDDKLKLTATTSNPFAGATPEQLAQLKKSFITTMSDPKLITDAEYEEVNGARR